VLLLLLLLLLLLASLLCCSRHLAKRPAVAWSKGKGPTSRKTDKGLKKTTHQTRKRQGHNF
jgi:hypothetical protein